MIEISFCINYINEEWTKPFINETSFNSMKNYKFAIVFVSLYLIAFAIAGRLGADLSVMLILFSLSPFLILWMVYSVLKYGKHSGKTLAEDEEWAYDDIHKDRLS